jgi:hypothetical protein
VQCGVGACVILLLSILWKEAAVGMSAACAGACRGYQPHRSKAEALVEPAPRLGGVFDEREKGYQNVDKLYKLG